MFVLMQRVMMHPATDEWMMGDRYATVSAIMPGAVKVTLDKSRRELLIPSEQFDLLAPITIPGVNLN